jgi:hypothetical protein
LSLLLKPTLQCTTRKENLEGLEVSGIYQYLVEDSVVETKAHGISIDPHAKSFKS